MNIAVLFSLLLLSQVIVKNEKKIGISISFAYSCFCKLKENKIYDMCLASFSLDLVGFSLPLGVDVSKAEDLKAFMPLTSMGKAT